MSEMTYRRVHQAPPELLFDCMTQPEHLTRFWGPAGTSAPLDGITVDLRPGGSFETVMVSDADGGQYTMRAVYVEVRRPSRLVWTEPGVEGGTHPREEGVRVQTLERARPVFARHLSQNGHRLPPRCSPLRAAEVVQLEEAAHVKRRVSHARSS